MPPQTRRLRRVLGFRRQRRIQFVPAHQPLLPARPRLHLPQFLAPPLLRIAASQIREVGHMLPIRRPRNPHGRVPEQTRPAINPLHREPVLVSLIILRRRHRHLPKCGRHSQSKSHHRTQQCRTQAQALHSHASSKIPPYLISRQRLSNTEPTPAPSSSPAQQVTISRLNFGLRLFDVLLCYPRFSGYTLPTFRVTFSREPSERGRSPPNLASASQDKSVV